MKLIALGLISLFIFILPGMSMEQGVLETDLKTVAEKLRLPWPGPDEQQYKQQLFQFLNLVKEFRSKLNANHSKISIVTKKQNDLGVLQLKKSIIDSHTGELHGHEFTSMGHSYEERVKTILSMLQNEKIPYLVDFYGEIIEYLLQHQVKYPDLHIIASNQPNHRYLILDEYTLLERWRQAPNCDLMCILQSLKEFQKLMQSTQKIPKHHCLFLEVLTAHYLFDK